MTISVVTPTCDRPEGLRRLAGMLARQTVHLDEWVVVDGGSDHPAADAVGGSQVRIVRPIVRAMPGAINFCQNISLGMESASCDLVVICEDDDYYAATHLEQVVALLREHPGAWAAGDDLQRYYHLPTRQYRLFDNVGASMCQTALRRAAIPLMQEVVLACASRNSYGVDTTFWRALPQERWAIRRIGTVVGLKGLPGQAGLGIGHRPSGSLWSHDPKGDILRAWIGDPDAEAYLSLSHLESKR